MIEQPGDDGYNAGQWKGFKAIFDGLGKMEHGEIQSLRETARPYLTFREELDAFQKHHTEAHCAKACYETKVSACCGFESIYTFFADQVLTVLFSHEDDIAALLNVLTKPNRTKNCVYLGPAGCIWKVRPISCAMFFCDEVKSKILQGDPGIQEAWEQLRKREKEFTWPDRWVLFDHMEKYFMKRGVDTPFMYFHKSPGLLRVKKRFNHGRY